MQGHAQAQEQKQAPGLPVVARPVIAPASEPDRNPDAPASQRGCEKTNSEKTVDLS
jgi:hypothetical protein